MSGQCIPGQVLIEDPATTQAAGDRLIARLRTFAAGETIGETEGDLFEEVGAVVQGAFHIAAAGEDYDLSAGEGIIIPPGEPREWRCTEGPGLLYRVQTRGGTA